MEDPWKLVILILGLPLMMPGVSEKCHQLLVSLLSISRMDCQMSVLVDL